MNGSLWVTLLLCISANCLAGIEGVVTDGRGARIASARLTLQSSGGTVVAEATSDQEGRFSISGPASGRFLLRAVAAGFSEREQAVTGSTDEALTVVLAVAPVANEVTVAAVRGSVEDLTTSPLMTSVAQQHDYESAPAATLGSALTGRPGILPQQTTAGQTSPFLRGLTGYQTLILLDGIRYNTALFRSGPNQYLAFIDPFQTDRMELILGPNSAAWGSDALGGTIAVMTPDARLSDSARGWDRPRGEVYLAGNSGDLSAVSRVNGAISRRALWIYGSAGLRRHNDIRPGGGFDSHNVYRRWFGLNSEQLREVVGNRLQDTAFTQHAQQIKAAFAPGARQQITLLYQQTIYEGLRSYRDLLGGLGRLQSLYDPQDGKLAYARYERLRTGFFDSLSGTFSVNRQVDGSIRQGASFSSPITTEDNSVTALGYGGQATTHIGGRHLQTFGGEIYDEQIDAWRHDRDPVRGTVARLRPAVPDDSRYRTSGAFLHNSSELIRGRVLASAAVRYARASFGTRADDLGGIESRSTFDDFTFNTALRYQATEAIGLHASVNRGFRAPNVTDLANVGLTSLGYEIPLQLALQHGALIGLTAAENALPRPGAAGPLRPETVISYEIGASVRTRAVQTRIQLFDAEMADPVVRRTVLFPVEALPRDLGGVPVTPVVQTAAQRQSGVAGVATALDPRSVKAFVNDGQSRYYGLEWALHWNIGGGVRVDTAWTYLNGRELFPNRTARRLPPANGFTSLRYSPGGHRWWVESVMTYSAAQERLAAGDLDDERIGGSRRRTDIAAFFNSAVVSRWISGGVFVPTGETLRQIQDRVLPIGATIDGVRITDDNSRVPLLNRTAGWFQHDVRFGWHAGEHSTLYAGVFNLFDASYRMHGSGVDATGISAFVGLKLRF
ncbi:MAG TPA: TonB-dependent receptor [Bryobacteraceae bacterium]|nr:TonB-dependent receptor [Bryobacteraceae bacterium]